MKAFMMRVFLVVVFCIGLGGIAEKVGLYFEPEENELITLREIPPPDIKVVRMNQPRKIIVRSFHTEGARDCRMKIGPMMPIQVERPADFVLEEKISQ